MEPTREQVERVADELGRVDGGALTFRREVAALLRALWLRRNSRWAVEQAS